MPRIKYQEAVGLKVTRGKPAMGNKPSKSELEKLYIKESKSIREIAEILGCTKDMIYRALKDYGIQTREHVKKSILWDYNLELLEIGIKRMNHIALLQACFSLADQKKWCSKRLRSFFVFRWRRKGVLYLLRKQ